MNAPTQTITAADFAAAPRVRPLDEVALAEQQFRDHAADTYAGPDVAGDLFTLECMAATVAAFVADMARMHRSLDIARDVQDGHRVVPATLDPAWLTECITEALPLSVEAATVLSARFAIAAAGAPRKVA